MRRVELKTVQELKRSLNVELQEKNPVLSMRAVVKELLPEIKAAMRRGYSVEEIAKHINKRIPINEGTLRGYMYGKDRVDGVAGSSAKKR